MLVESSDKVALDIRVLEERRFNPEFAVFKAVWLRFYDNRYGRRRISDHWTCRPIAATLERCRQNRRHSKDDPRDAPGIFATGRFGEWLSTLSDGTCGGSRFSEQYAPVSFALTNGHGKRPWFG